jgi:hypothetical protein
MPFRRYLAAALAAAALAAPAMAQSAGGATQVVQGTVDAQFGIAIDSAGHVSTSATTIPASVTREFRNGVEIITITPLQ